jgi:hypothetical protein
MQWHEFSLIFWFSRPLVTERALASRWTGVCLLLPYLLILAKSVVADPQLRWTADRFRTYASYGGYSTNLPVTDLPGGLAMVVL